MHPREQNAQMGKLAVSRRRVLNILCAEDHELMADVLRHALLRGGHQVTRVADGQQALELITACVDHFDVLITDHQMPRLSGLGLVSKLRDTAFVGTIIVHSSLLTPAEVEAYRALLVDHILRKPTQLDVLTRVIQEIAAITAFDAP